MDGLDLRHDQIRLLVRDQVAQRGRIERPHPRHVHHRAFRTWRGDAGQARPRKVLHPRAVRRDRIDFLNLGPRARRIPPVVNQKATAAMRGGPFGGELLHGVISAVPVDDQDAAEPTVRQAVEDVTDDAEMRLDFERNRSRELAEIRRDAVGQHREDQHAERLCSFYGDALGQNAVDREPQVGMLLGAPDGEHRAVVVLQV